MHYPNYVISKAQNNPYFIVEGRSAARLFLSWTTEDIRKVWQKPVHNSFANPTKMRFMYHDIEAMATIYNGRIIQISYFVRQAQDKWSTAFGVNASLLEKLDSEQAILALIEHYQKQKIILEYIRYKDIIEFTSLGVRYHFSNNQLMQIDVFADMVREVSLPKLY